MISFTQKDFDESSRIAEILKKINTIDANYVNLISDEIFHKQPFFLSVLLGYRLDTSTEELEEIMYIYFLLWEYFRTNKNVQKKKVTKSFFEKIQKRNLEMLRYAEGESENQNKIKIYATDIQHLKSKALLTGVLFRYNTRPVLMKMDETKKGIIYLGIKSFIECFESLIS